MDSSFIRNYDTASVFFHEFVQPLSEDIEDIDLDDLLYEIEENQAYVQQTRDVVHEGISLRVLDCVLSVAVFAAKNEYNTAEGKKAIQKMRAAIEALENVV
jgi:hypothetical protein